jgi:hypothetical protein
VARWRASGESARVFAARSGWSPRTLSWWSSRLRRESADSERVEFVELVARGTPSFTPADAIDVVLANGTRIQVRAGFDEELLLAVVRTLESK